MVALAQRNGEFGYARLVGVRAADLKAVQTALKKGLPFASVERFRALTAFQNKEIMAVTRMTPATYARRKAAGRLSQAESERLLKATRIFSLALKLYGGNPAAAQTYLRTPSAELDGALPLAMLIADEESARQVEDLLFAQLRGDVLG